MELQRYLDQDNKYRTAMIANKGRKWMLVLEVKDGALKLVKRPMTDTKYMTPMPWTRKSKASLRRLARRRGTSRAVRLAVKEI